MEDENNIIVYSQDIYSEDAELLGLEEVLEEDFEEGDDIFQIVYQENVNEDPLEPQQTVSIIGMGGDVLFQDSFATFATSKEEAKKILGGAKKEGQLLLVSDAHNKRAFIMDADKTIVWEYTSNNYISDFVTKKSNQIEITINDGFITNGEIIVEKGTTVVWTNKTHAPISIYSGFTTYDDFYNDPDLSLYGNEFSSATLDVGESFSFIPETLIDFEWFVYPSIMTGVIRVVPYYEATENKYYIIENDGMNMPNSSRIILLDSQGNVEWSFGEGYLINPKSVQSLLNGNILIST